MSLEYSLMMQEACSPTLALRPMPWSVANRRMLEGSNMLITSVSYRVHETRRIIRRDVCSSVANLVHVQADPAGPAESVLISPRHSTIDANGNRVLVNPTIYIIDGARGVCHIRTEAFCAKHCPSQIDMLFLRHAIANRASFAPITDASRRAFRAGEFPHINTRTRLGLWHREMRRQRASADRGLDLRIVAESARYYDEVSWMVVEPLIEEVRQAERQLIASFLRPLLESRLKRRLPRRFTAAERDQHRSQAIAAYPFLKDLWHRDPKTESPDANSLTGRLHTKDKQLLRRAIDEGLPLTELLAQLLNLEPWMLNHVRDHWSTFRAYDRVIAPDGQWELGRTLSLFTPQTAPTKVEELHRLRKLTERIGRTPTPLAQCLGANIPPHDQRQLKAVIGSATKTSLLLEYLEFVYSLNAWVSKRLGQNHYVQLPELLGVCKFNDWWILARRWQSRNRQLQRQRVSARAANDEQIEIAWPSLLTRVERIGSFSFTSRRSHAELLLESELMRNCAASYVVRCALAESHLLHIAYEDDPVGTVEVRKEWYGDNPKLLLVHAETHEHRPLDSEAENALMHFLDACNDGQIGLNPEALQPRSVHADLLGPLLQSIPMEYSHWVRNDLEMHYFDLHTETSGALVLEHYRDALQFEHESPDCLYELALRALQRNQSMNSMVREYLDVAVCAY